MYIHCHYIYIYVYIYIPAPSKGWCLNPKGLLNGTPYHPFGTPWRVQVYIYIYTYLYLYQDKWYKPRNSDAIHKLTFQQFTQTCYIVPTKNCKQNDEKMDQGSEKTWKVSSSISVDSLPDIP